MPETVLKILQRTKARRAPANQPGANAGLIDSAEWIAGKPCLSFFAKTGIRRQELIDLDLKDLYIESRYAVLKPHAKRSNRVVFFDQECAQILEAWLSWRQEHKIKSKTLFVGVQGSRISRDAVYETTTEHAQRLGFHNSKSRLHEKFTPHCFRHWFTTWLRRSGCLVQLYKNSGVIPGRKP
ncbi:tyrosine-type recombinase/integrase [Methanosarcina horonobensis]|uniref:tyrosine-type recombinase/integrase n=1 Tax=Methanosarcina horonobensis TaxID=418008 RepID=UPI002FCDEDBA